MKFFTKKELKIFLIFWVIFSVFATSDRWNDNSTLDLTMAIVDEHRFEIDSYFNNTGDRTFYDGHYYSDKVPGAAFLAVPLYQAYKTFVGEIPYHNSLEEDNPSWKYNLFLFIVISLVSAVCGALTVVLVYKILKYFTSNEFHKNLVILTLGLGTLLSHAARQFNSHAISTFFIFLCFYLVFKMKKEKKDYSFIAGLAGGFALLTEYRTIIILLGIFVLVLISKKWKWILKFTVGVLLFYSILLLYNYTLYDSPFRDVMIYDDKNLWENQMSIIKCSYAKPKYLDNITSTPLLIVKRMSYIGHINLLKRDIYIMMKLLFDPFKGLIFYSPIILLSFMGLFFMFKKYKAETLVILLCFLVYLLHLSTLKIWWGGLSFGPRHITPIIPFLMIPLLYTFKRFNIKIVLFFVVFSVLISSIGLQSVNLSHDPIIFNKEDYCEKIMSYKPLANPLFENYIPSLFNSFTKTSENPLVLEKLLGFNMFPYVYTLLLLVFFLLILKNRW